MLLSPGVLHSGTSLTEVGRRDKGAAERLYTHSNERQSERTITRHEHNTRQPGHRCIPLSRVVCAPTTQARA
eukprot:scaffold18122_cov68-Phaeocystis_antarctica.AAC.4